MKNLKTNGFMEMSENEMYNINGGNEETEGWLLQKLFKLIIKIYDKTHDENNYDMIFKK